MLSRGFNFGSYRPDTIPALPKATNDFFRISQKTTHKKISLFETFFLDVMNKQI
jgi:hypothetical protein